MKKHSRKPKDLEIVKFGGISSALMLGKSSPTKYDDPGNPTITVKVRETIILNTLFDLGVAINIMTRETFEQLGVTTLFGLLKHNYYIIIKLKFLKR